MTSSLKKAARILALLCVLALVACNGQAGEPTTDPQAIFTAAAQTVEAQLTQTAAAAQPSQNPQAIYTAAAQTVVAGLTQTAAAQPTVKTVGTLPPLPAPGGSTLPALAPLPTIPGLATATRPAGAVADKCTWQRNDPADNTVFDPNVHFDLQYYLKNSGTTTWNTNYLMRYYVGDYFVTRRDFNFRESSAPGQVTRVIADAIAPSTAGTYKATFVMTNDQGQNFCVVDFTFSVGSTVAATQGGPTNTPDSLAWVCAFDGSAKTHGDGCFTQCTTGSPNPCYCYDALQGSGGLYVAGNAPGHQCGN